MPWYGCKQQGGNSSLKNKLAEMQGKDKVWGADSEERGMWLYWADCFSLLLIAILLQWITPQSALPSGYPVSRRCGSDSSAGKLYIVQTAVCIHIPCHGMWMHLKPQERCQNPGTCSCAVKTRRNLKKKQKEDGRNEPERQKKNMNQTYGKSAGDTNWIMHG